MSADLRDRPELDALRAAVDEVHPPAALRDAVLRDLAPVQAGGAGAASRWFVGGAAGALALAATLLVVVRAGGPDDAPGPVPRAPGPVPRAPAPADAARDAKARAAIDAARARNVAAYARERERLLRDAKGQWALIAERDPATVDGAYKPVVVGASPEALAGLAPDVPHRFLFRVGDEGDLDVFVSEWYAARFAGSGFSVALGLGTTLAAVEGTYVEHGGRTLHTTGAFPRVPFTLGVPGAPATVPPRAGEVFLGSLGPDLMLTPQDDEALHLERFEVPGTATVMGLPCRRVLVTAAVPAVGASGVVVACVPSVPYATLVNLARGRGMFWTWPESLQAALDLPAPADPRGTWIVFGSDRVLGRGTTPAGALAQADALGDVTLHRYLLPWPLRVRAPVAGADAGTTARVGDAVDVEIGGLRLRGRRLAAVSYYRELEFPPPAPAPAPPAAPTPAAAPTPTPVIVLDDATPAAWIAAGLHLAEFPDGLRGVDLPISSPARVAFARCRVGPVDRPADAQATDAILVAPPDGRMDGAGGR